MVAATLTIVRVFGAVEQVASPSSVTAASSRTIVRRPATCRGGAVVAGVGDAALVGGIGVVTAIDGVAGIVVDPRSRGPLEVQRTLARIG